MVSNMKAIVQALDTILVAVNDGATPTPVKYFDHVWIGMPKKIPQGDRNIAIIELIGHPEFIYTTCPENTMYDMDINIHIMCKGEVEVSNLRLLEVTQATLTALLGNSKISNTCMDSTIEQVEYGDFAAEGRNLIAGSRIVLRCRL